MADQEDPKSGKTELTDSAVYRLENRLAQRIDLGLTEIRAAVQSTMGAFDSTIQRRMKDMQTEIKQLVSDLDKSLEKQMTGVIEAVQELHEGHEQNLKELRDKVDAMERERGVSESPHGIQ
jgi:gas vesicle protein